MRTSQEAGQTSSLRQAVRCACSEVLRWFGLRGVEKNGQRFHTAGLKLKLYRSRTPFWHRLLLFQSAIVGRAHSGIGVFVMTEAERKRHDARLLAYGRRLLQGQAKVKTHDVAHAYFASWIKVQVWKALERVPCSLLTCEFAS